MWIPALVPAAWTRLRDLKYEGKLLELTFFPSLNLTCPSATTVSVIFCHGSEQLCVYVCVSQAPTHRVIFQNSLLQRRPLRPAHCSPSPRQWDHRSGQSLRPPPPAARVSTVVRCLLFTMELIRLKAHNWRTFHLTGECGAQPGVRQGFSVALMLISGASFCLWKSS